MGARNCLFKARDGHDLLKLSNSTVMYKNPRISVQDEGEWFGRKACLILDPNCMHMSFSAVQNIWIEGVSTELEFFNVSFLFPTVPSDVSYTFWKLLVTLEKKYYLQSTSQFRDARARSQVLSVSGFAYQECMDPSGFRNVLCRISQYHLFPSFSFYLSLSLCNSIGSRHWHEQSHPWCHAVPGMDGSVPHPATGRAPDTPRLSFSGVLWMCARNALVS